MAREAFGNRHVTEKPARVPVGHRGFSEISVHRRRADADQHRVIMGVETFGGADVDAGIGAQPLAHQMRVDSGRGKHARNRDPPRPDSFVGQEQVGAPLAHCLFSLGANVLNRRAQCLRPTASGKGAVDFGRLWSKIGAQPVPVSASQHGGIKHQHPALRAGRIKDVGQIAEPRLQRHHSAFAQRIDRRIGDLREILAEKLGDRTRPVRNHRQRRVIAHRADRFLPLHHERGEYQFHVLQRLTRRNLAPDQLGSVVTADVVGHLRQVVDCQILADHRGIIGLARNAVLDRAVAKHPACVQIDRDHLARPQPPLGDDRRLGHHYHPAFAADDQQAVARPAVAQGTQRVAVNASDRPAAIGHRERGRAVPRLHHARQILIHGTVIGGHIGLVLPRLWHEHQLGGRRVAARAANRLEHRV